MGRGWTAEALPFFFFRVFSSHLKRVSDAGQRARAAAKKAGRLHISAALPCLARAAREAAERGLFHVDVKLEGVWFMDKTNQRDLRCASAVAEAWRFPPLTCAAAAFCNRSSCTP